MFPNAWRSRYPLLIATAVGALFPATGAFAQEAPSAQAEETAPGAADDIVVTAQRRTERLQDVPISATVIGQEVRIQQNLNGLSAVAQIAPSVHVNAVGRSSELYIRGIGSGQNQSFDQSVGIFIDDIYHGRSRTSAVSFLDLERLEILKGPQTTFFGNNAIAGALNIIAKKPGDHSEGFVRALYGEDGQYAFEGGATAPISDILSARIAGTATGMKGWLKNDNLDRHEPNDNNVAGRVTLKLSPNDAFDATLKVEGGRNRSRGALPLQFTSCPAPAPFRSGTFCNIAIANDVPTSVGSEHVSKNGGTGSRLSSFETVLTMNYELSSGHVLTSTTSYQRYRYNLNLDNDLTPVALLNVQAPETFHQFSQELRVASPVEKPVSYLAGAYFQSDRLNSRTTIAYPFLNPNVQAAAALAALVPYLPIVTNTVFTQPERVYSIFGSATWSVTDRLKLTGALRRSWVKKSIDQSFAYGTSSEDFGGFTPLPASVAPIATRLNLGIPAVQAARRTDGAWMPSARVQFEISKDAMAYASYSRGFKAGGFNGADNSGVAANLPFEPEKVDAYEVGLKTELFDRRLIFNLAAFLSDYSNLQVSIQGLSSSGGLTSIVRNAASSRSQGIELESQFRVSRALRLSADITYLDAHYVDYSGVSPTARQQLAGQTSQDLSGRPTSFAPHWSGSVATNLTVPLSDGLELGSEARVSFSSPYYVSQTDDPLLRQDSYARVDGRISLQSSGGRWAIDLIGKNLTNRNILLFGNNMPTSLGSFLIIKQQPRNVAVQLRYSW